MTTYALPTTRYNETDDGSEVDSFRIYCSDMARFPLLTHEQECALARRAQAGDVEARHYFTACNLKLVIAIAKKYISEGWTLEDLISEGNMGLMKAVARFDPEAGWKFSTYATWWIKQAIGRAKDERTHLIRLPAHAGTAVKQMRKAMARLEEQLHREATLAEIASAMGWTREKTEDIRRASQSVLSLSLSRSQERADAEGGDGTLGDTLSDMDEARDVAHIAVQHDVAGRVRALLETLSAKERVILSLRYGLGEAAGRSHTLEEVGKELHVTRERVRQLEAKALKKLREREDVLRLREEVAG